jgi:hypothetical protein
MGTVGSDRDLSMRSEGQGRDTFFHYPVGHYAHRTVRYTHESILNMVVLIHTPVWMHEGTLFYSEVILPGEQSLPWLLVQ